MDKIVQAIRDRIKEKGTTQEAVAEAIGVLPSNLSKRLNSGSMKTKEVIKICDVLDLELQAVPK